MTWAAVLIGGSIGVALGFFLAALLFVSRHQPPDRGRPPPRIPANERFAGAMAIAVMRRFDQLYAPDLPRLTAWKAAKDVWMVVDGAEDPWAALDEYMSLNDLASLPSPDAPRDPGGGER